MTASQTANPNLPPTNPGEVSRLRQELQLRDQLVQQLSQELFRLVKGNTNFMPQPEVSERHQAQMRLLREQLQEVEQQVEFYQKQISTRDAEIYQLRQSVQELTDRSRMLEQAVQELPKIYRKKFAERLVPVREKVERLQKENRQLHTELQSVSYRLAVKTRRSAPSQVDLPSFSRPDAAPIPAFGHAY
jgi:chromosome segregation ATPase